MLSIAVLFEQSLEETNLKKYNTSKHLSRKAHQIKWDKPGLAVALSKAASRLKKD